MPFNWKEYFTLAQYLEKCADDSFSKEATLRTGIGRIYFAAYNIGRNFAVTRQGFAASKTSDDHAKLIIHFKTKRATGIGLKLENLRNKRNLCDYEQEVENLEEMFNEAIEIFNKLEAAFR